MTTLRHYPLGDLAANDRPAKRCPNCGATHHDGLYLTCDECRVVVDAVPVLRITIDADTPAELYRGMLGSVHEQNAAALDGQDFADAVRGRMYELDTILNDEPLTFAEATAITNEMAELDTWIQQHAAEAYDPLRDIADAQTCARFGSSL